MNRDPQTRLASKPAESGRPMARSRRTVVQTTGPGTLIDRYLHEQQTLTAVEEFSRAHDDGVTSSQAQRYTALMPAAPPRDGEQYAFEVDLDACSGCKACVTACHSLNGLDEDETWRRVGLLQGGSDEFPVLQHVTSACHHCLEPPCLTACPVDAYEKDPRTGIVRHLDDQCIGCQYCTLSCPYDVPRYHKQKGIVRKCDMCSQRLAVGEAPACVQACPQEAIRITVVREEDVIAESESNRFVPGAHDPRDTLPTTNYKTSRELPRNLLPADYYSVRPEHAHWPLVVMLVLTQLSVGAFLVDFVSDRWFAGTPLEPVRPIHAAGALLFGLVALGTSLFHLGRPRYAYRAVIGLRHSWLSREIVAFGLFAPLAAVYAMLLGGVSTAASQPARSVVGIAVLLSGLAGVGCSVMVYQSTRRVFWNGFATTARFVGTSLLLGLATVLCASALTAGRFGFPPIGRVMSDFGVSFCGSLIVVATVKLLFEAGVFRHLRDRRHTALRRSAMLMSGPLSNAVLARFGCGIVGGLWLPGILLLRNWAGTTTAAGDFVTCLTAVMIVVGSLTGELLERYLFFTAVVRPRMPGRLAP